MSILYALVSRDTTVLAEAYTSSSNTYDNIPTVTRVLLATIPTENENACRMSYEYDLYLFHCIIEHKIIYLCMGLKSENNKRRIAFSYLDTVKDIFTTTYGPTAYTAIAFSLNEEFGKTLKTKMDYFNSPAADNFAVVNTKLDDVRNVMFENINEMMDRGERLDTLVIKTEQLREDAFRFQSSARSLKNTMISRKIKIYALLFIVVALIVWIISAIICGISYDKCK